MRAGIALGSNLGDLAANLRRARDLVSARAAPGPVLSAPLYWTAPVDCPENSPDFYNTVIEIPWAGTALELLDLTQSIQRRLGRPDIAPRNAPRVIDLDLLYLGDTTVEDGRLRLPHPRIALRRFVLQPLADIRPDLVLPRHSLSIHGLLSALPPGEPALDLVATTW